MDKPVNDTSEVMEPYKTVSSGGAAGGGGRIEEDTSGETGKDTSGETSMEKDGTGYIVNEYESFDDMGLEEEILMGIYSMGFNTPSVIQQRAIKPLMEGYDLIAQAQSGTGKTATFLIGALSRVDVSIKQPQVIIMSNCRELSQQIYFNFEGLNHAKKAKGCLLLGGTNVNQNFKDLDAGAQFIIGTPGRIYDMLKRYALKTDKLKVLILDEADELLSKGFKEQIYEIYRYIPKECQTCLFSATMPEAALEMTKLFMNKPVSILVKKERLTLDGIKQYYLGVPHESWKIATLGDLYERLKINQTIIFCNSRRKVEWLKEQLEARDFTCGTIHGDMTQLDRDKVMKSFRTGEYRILITTDIIARGIDIQQVSIVINYDIPRDRETYIHRIGRSGRYGRKGWAINFCTEIEYENLKRIEEYYDTEIIPLPDNIKKLI